MPPDVIKKMIEVLKWAEFSYDGKRCPCCVSDKSEGHAEDCKVGNVLKMVRGATRKRRVKLC